MTLCVQRVRCYGPDYDIRFGIQDRFGGWQLVIRMNKGKAHCYRLIDGEMLQANNFPEKLLDEELAYAKRQIDELHSSKKGA